MSKSSNSSGSEQKDKKHRFGGKWSSDTELSADTGNSFAPPSNENKPTDSGASRSNHERDGVQDQQPPIDSSKTGEESTHSTGTTPVNEGHKEVFCTSTGKPCPDTSDDQYPTRTDQVGLESHGESLRDQTVLSETQQSLQGSTLETAKGGLFENPLSSNGDFLRDNAREDDKTLDANRNIRSWHSSQGAIDQNIESGGDSPTLGSQQSAEESEQSNGQPRSQDREQGIERT